MDRIEKEDKAVKFTSLYPSPEYGTDGRAICTRCHARPMIPYQQTMHPRSGVCSLCQNKAGMKRRTRQWEEGRCPRCKNHPDKMVYRSYWTHTGRLLCSACRSPMPCQEREYKGSRSHLLFENTLMGEKEAHDRRKRLGRIGGERTG